MKKNSEISGEAFTKLLQWLADDVEEAGKKYLTLRNGVIALFRSRACLDAESLADEVMDRIAGKLSEGVEIQNPAAYVRRVAHYRYLEYHRNEANRFQPLDDEESAPPLIAEEPVETSTRLECLERCFGEMFPNERDLILRYYHSEKRARINYRSELARELSVGGAALRVRAHRIRLKLEACINQCEKKS